MKTLCRLLIASMLWLPFSTRAGMIPTGQIVSGAVQASGDVSAVAARAGVQKQMEALGLAAADAKVRVDALTDEEVARVAGKLDSAPAGAMDTLLGLALLAAILAAIVWLNYK